MTRVGTLSASTIGILASAFSPSVTMRSFWVPKPVLTLMSAGSAAALTVIASVRPCVFRRHPTQHRRMIDGKSGRTGHGQRGEHGAQAGGAADPNTHDAGGKEEEHLLERQTLCHVEERIRGVNVPGSTQNKQQRMTSTRKPMGKQVWLAESAIGGVILLPGRKKVARHFVL